MSTLVNVLGNVRSGTTMMDLMLGSGKSAFSCGEVHAWFRPFRPHHIGKTMPIEWKAIKHVDESEFHAAVVQDRGVDFVIDSSKHLPWVLDAQKWAANSGMKVYNLVMWKRPVDYACSLWKRDSYERWYSYYVRPYLSVFGAKMEFATVSVSDLIARPAAKLEEICDYIGMPYFEGKHRFWEYDHKHLFGSGGVRKQVEYGGSKIRAADRPAGFAPYEQEIHDLERQDKVLLYVSEMLRRNEVSQASTSSEGHRHGDPPLWYLATQYYPEKVKRYLQGIKAHLEVRVERINSGSRKKKDKAQF